MYLKLPRIMILSFFLCLDVLSGDFSGERLYAVEVFYMFNTEFVLLLSYVSFLSAKQYFLAVLNIFLSILFFL